MVTALGLCVMWPLMVLQLALHYKEMGPEMTNS